MLFRCPYCKQALGEQAPALCPHCRKGIHIPDHLKPVPFRERKRTRESRVRDAALEHGRRRFDTPALPLGRRPLSVLITVGVLSLFGALLVRGVRHRPAAPCRTLQDVTQEELNVFRLALDGFRADCGRYPAARSGLMALINNPGEHGWKGPYVTLVKSDPWRRRYVYELDADQPVLLSLGPDGQRGTADDLAPRGWQSLTNTVVGADGIAIFPDSVSVRIR
jgi:general secretion pathway protein G